MKNFTQTAARKTNRISRTMFGLSSIRLALRVLEGIFQYTLQILHRWFFVFGVPVPVRVYLNQGGRNYICRVH